MEDMDVLRRKWERCFSEALEFDTWGQVEEASEGYARLRLSLQNTLQDAHQELTPQSRKNLESLAQCLLMRGKELDSGKDEGVGVHGMKLVTGFIRSVMEDEGPFPIRLRDAPPLPTIVPATDAVQETEGGTLLPPQVFLVLDPEASSVTPGILPPPPPPIQSWRAPGRSCS